MEFGYLGMDRCFYYHKGFVVYEESVEREGIRNSITPLSKMKLEEQAQLRKEQYHQAILEQEKLGE
jgi:hypothetical protein